MEREDHWSMECLDGEEVDPIFDESLARWNDAMSREALELPTAEEDMLDPYADQLLDPGPIELEERMLRIQAIGATSIPPVLLLDPESREQDAMIDRIQEIRMSASPDNSVLDPEPTPHEVQISPIQETGVSARNRISVLDPDPTPQEEMMAPVPEVGVESAESPLISYEASSSDESSAIDTPPLSPTEADNKFRCKLCSKEFDNRKRFNGHAKFHYKFQCPICGCKLKWRKALIAHCLTFHPDKCSTLDLQWRGKEMVVARKDEFKCGECGKAFRHRYQQERHERNHTGEKPFPCHQCPSAFNYPHTLNRHLISCTKKRMKVLEQIDRIETSIAS